MSLLLLPLYLPRAGDGGAEVLREGRVDDARLGDDAGDVAVGLSLIHI